MGAPSRDSLSRDTGLGGLRSPGRVTELLFLYEIATKTHSRFRSLARTLGVSVQTISLLHRELLRRGWIQPVEGIDRPTVAGIEALHESLLGLSRDLEERQARLRIIQNCRALALAPIRKGQPVVLQMRQGWLVARPGSGGASRGRARQAARTGDLVEVTDLQGIVPLKPLPISVAVLPGGRPLAKSVFRELEGLLRRERPEFLAADGLESWQALRRVTRRPIERFGVIPAAREAAQLGVPGLVVTTEENLPDLLRGFSEGSPRPTLSVRTLGRGRPPGSSSA